MKTTEEVRERLTKLYDGLQKNIAELPRAKQSLAIANGVIKTFLVDNEREKMLNRKDALARKR